MTIPTPGHLTDRRKELSEKIARQRTELSVAYRGLIQPCHYADTGVSALNTLRKNGWLIALAPSAVKLVYSLFGYEKRAKPSLLGRLRRKGAGKTMRVEEEAEDASKLRKPLSRWAGRAWSLFQVYRKIRPFFP